MAGNFLYLITSVVLSSGRSVFSKKMACLPPKPGLFFRNQMLLFLSAGLLLWAGNPDAFAVVSPVTIGYSVIYGLLLIASQWMYTFAMRLGLTSVCSLIYSLGFIFPTISGVLFWNETFTGNDFLGLVLAFSVILLNFRGDAEGVESGKKTQFLLAILTAMTASGGLGILQKVQQSTEEAAAETSAFLILAFVLAFTASGSVYLFRRSWAPESADAKKTAIRGMIWPVLAGLCFGGANLLNTVLAGRMKSAVFFPLLNILTILLCTFCGILLFREKLTLKTVIGLILGMVAVVVLSI